MMGSKKPFYPSIDALIESSPYRDEPDKNEVLKLFSGAMLLRMLHHDVKKINESPEAISLLMFVAESGYLGVQLLVSVILLRGASKTISSSDLFLSMYSLGIDASKGSVDRAIKSAIDHRVFTKHQGTDKRVYHYGLNHDMIEPFNHFMTDYFSRLNNLDQYDFDEVRQDVFPASEVPKMFQALLK